MKKFILLLFLIFIVLILTGCGEEKECKKESDCIQQKCFTTSCNDGSCVKTPMQYCCGNLMCEEDAQENSCTCGMDCKPACDGDYVLREIRGKNVYAEYLDYRCVNDLCILGVDPTAVTKIPLIDEISILNVKLDVGTTFNKPFDIVNDVIEVTIKLKDFPDNIKLPIKITNIQVLAGEVLYGQKPVNKQLMQVGASIKEFVPLTFIPSEREEENTLVLNIEYELIKIDSKGENIIRGSYPKKFGQKIFIVRSGAVE